MQAVSQPLAPHHLLFWPYLTSTSYPWSTTIHVSMRLFETPPSLNRWLLRKLTGWSRFNYHFLSPCIAAEVFHCPDGGREGLFTVWKLDLHLPQGFAGISDHSHLLVMFLFQSSTETVERKTCLKVKLIVLIWVGLTWGWSKLLF